MSKLLDFIVIGTPKSGTTALHMYIKEHPDLAIPKSKELSFFSENSIYKRGFDWYLEQLPHRNGAITGTVTPQYMLGSQDTNVETIAKRIHKHAPNAKLIVLLRNPISRAFSHYKMVYRRGYEERPFDEAIRASIAKRPKMRHLDYTMEPLVGSEYGAALAQFYNLFPKRQILVMFAEDLRKNPEKETKQFLKFIGANPDKLPLPLHQGDVHQGGLEPKLKFLTPRKLKRIPGLSFTWNKLTPYPIKKFIDFGINKWNIKPDSLKLTPNNEVYAELTNYYRKDVKILEKLIDTKTPWKDFDS